MPEPKVLSKSLAFKPNQQIQQTHQKTKNNNPKIPNFGQRLITLKTKIKAKNKKVPLKITESLAKNKAQIIIIKPEKIANQPDISLNPSNLALCPTQTTSSKVEDLVLVAQAQASLIGFDEINKLIKKLTLSFSTQKSESSFFIKTGVFEGARFHIKSQEKDLHLKINNLATNAHEILSAHQDYLRLRLSQKEINLASIMLNS